MLKVVALLATNNFAKNNINNSSVVRFSDKMIDSSVFPHTTVYAPRFPKIPEAVKSPDVVPFPICITEIPD